jgi:hypothetical protein
MANSNFVVHNGLTVGPLTIDAATGTLNTTGPIVSTSTTPAVFSGANLVAASGTASTTIGSGALVVVGGLGVSGNINVGGSVNITGNITVTGNSVSIGSTSLSVVDPIINLHSPNDNSPLTFDDGADIGILMHYYKASVGGDNHAFLGLANDSGFLEFYSTGSDTSNVFTGTAYGTIKSGEHTTSNATAATSSTTGAIRSVGGISTQGNIYVGSGAYFANSRSISKQVSTVANIAPTSAQVKIGDQWYDSASDTLYQYINDGTTNGFWVDITSVPYNYQANVAIAGGTLSITGNGSVGNLTVSGKLSATATSALYADLAELYSADTSYAPGTVVVFSQGDEEITQSTTDHDPSVAGVISTDPAYLMNNNYPIGTYQPVALTGRVPCRVQGPVTKGQVLVTGTEPGTAIALDPAKFQPGVVIGKSLEKITDNSVQTIEIAVGRF